MSNAGLSAPEMPKRIAARCGGSGGPRFRDDFDMCRFNDATWRRRRPRDRGAGRVPGAPRHDPEDEAALAVRPLAAVPCHNDLLAENYLDDGERLWIVDYEYSGNNDPTFELGEHLPGARLRRRRVAALCAAYFGQRHPALLARMRLQMIMSDVGWTLWAAIQARISTIDYDFAGWADERWSRAAAALDGTDFEGWLHEVTR